MQSQKDYEEEESPNGSGDECDTVADLTFSSSKPECYDKDGHPIMTVIDRSSVHNIGISWCHCSGAPKHNLQLMMAGLFLVTFANPRWHSLSGCWKTSIWIILNARQLQANFSAI
jgi:CxC2 like cysteine cluster associated with KDZ transposases